MTNPNDVVLERLIRRDAAVRRGGHTPDPRAETRIIEFINQRELHSNESARRWLVERGVTEHSRVAEHLMDTLAPLIRQGFHADALSILCTLLARGDTTKGAERRKSLLGRQSMFQPKIRKILATKGLMTQAPHSWGAAIIELQADLLFDYQIADSLCRRPGTDTNEPDYENYFQRTYFQRRRQHEAVYFVAEVIESALADSLRLEDADTFRLLTDMLLTTNWGLAKAQPLVALVDVAKESGLDAWQCDEASRLLGMDAIVESDTAYLWRRLLRSHVLPQIGTQQTLQLAEVVRRGTRKARLNELSDFQDTGVLTQEEMAALAAARDANEISAPYDPRELHDSREVSAWAGESPADEHVHRWPFADQHTAIRLLVVRKRPSKETTAEKLKEELFGRLNALRAITKRSHIDQGEWFGEVLEWCGEAIADLKQWMEVTHGISPDKPLPIDLYLKSLQDHCPWWKDRAESALNRLGEPPPSSHFESEQPTFSYGGDDPIAGSLKMLDELLAVEDGSELDEYKRSLYATICDVWSKWPLSTRGLAVWLLRPYHWQASNAMMDVLGRAVDAETDSEIVGFCLRHLLRFGRPEITPVMQRLLRRINRLSNPTDTAHLIGGVIGDAVMRYRACGEEHVELRALSEWFDELRDDRGQSVEVRQALIVSILDAAERKIASCEQHTKQYATEWVALTNWGISEWLDSNADVCDSRGLPSTPIRFARQHMWSGAVLSYVLRELHDVLIRVLREGGLGEFYFVHSELNHEVENKYIIAETGKRTSSGLPAIAFMSDDHRLAICRTSVARVADWRREGKTTNDLAYGSSLYGQDSKKLIENCFEVARDRAHVRRELVTIVDVFAADTELRHIANELRIGFRRANG